jgi:hypothetical protein
LLQTVCCKLFVANCLLQTGGSSTVGSEGA